MSCFLVQTVDGRKRMTPVHGREDYLRLRSSSAQLANLRLARGGDRAAKRRLVQMNYSCLPGEGGWLKGASAPSATVGMDVDFDPSLPDYAERLASAPENILARREELGLVMLERSATKGLHVVFLRRPELSQEDNLRWASRLLGIAFDEGAKDLTRVFFTTSASPDDLLFLDDRLFTAVAISAPQTAPASSTAWQDNPPAPSTKQQDQPSAPSAAQQDNPSAPSLARQDNPSVGSAPSSAPGAVGDVSPYPDTYNGTPYKDIVEALEDQLGGVPAHGSRNSFIFSMACHLRYVCDDSAEWIARVLPTYGEERGRWASTIRSACQRSQNKTLPRLLVRALDRARLAAEDRSARQGGSFSPEPPPMPRRLPPLVKLLVSRTPKVYQPAVAHAVFPALAAHLWRTRFRYIDNVEHEATLMNVLMAGTGAGKNCIAAPIDRIMADIRERDAVNLEKERLWKEETLSRGANKDKRKRPEGLVIQEVDPDMTNAAFVLRLAESEEHFLYARMNEIDQFDALKTSARSKSQFQIMCLAFDPGNTYGQTRVGTQSVSARVCIRFNWNASTTIHKGRRYFRQVLTDGPLSRINFCTIPEQPIGAPMPVYGTYDAAFDEALRPYIDRLNAARGLVECRQAQRLAKRLMEENAEFSRLSQSRTYENLSFRANVIAWLKAMVLYVAQGEQWGKLTEDFVRWSERYDLWCKMRFFGDDIERADGEEPACHPGPRNLLEMLPERFSLEEAVAVRRQQGMDAAGTKSMLNTWKSRGYIGYEQEGENKVYVKMRNNS